MSEVISHKSLVDVLRLLGKNTRLSSPRSLAAACGVSTELMVQILDILQNTSYVVVRTFPRGAFKSYKFTYYGKGYAFTDGFIFVIDGQIVAGSNRLSASALDKRERERCYNKAAELGLPVLGSGSFLETLVDKVYDIVNSGYLAEKGEQAQKAALDEKYKVFEKYPLSLAYYQKTEVEQAELEQQAADLEQKDVQAKKDFEQQTYLAKTGQRTRTENYSVPVGTEQIYVGSSRARYWFDDEGPVEHHYETVPRYKQRSRQVPDFPVEPAYHVREIADLKQQAKEKGYRLSYIKANLVSMEKDLQARVQEKTEHEQYLKEKEALRQKFGNRWD